MPSVHRKGRKQFAIRLTAKERALFEKAKDAFDAKDLSSFIIATIVNKAKEKGIKL